MAGRRVSVVLSSLALVLPLAWDASSGAAADWPEWRGPLRTGESPTANPPLEWAEGKNVRWKVDIPGLGLGSPIVSGEVVLVTTAVPGEKDPAVREFVVMAYERKDGKLRWRSVVHQEVPHEGLQENNSYASASLVTDGKRLFAFFGSRGLYALDLQGKPLWEKQLGKMQTRMGFGEGASPALYGDTLVVNWDHEGPDFVVALDAASGKERWRNERDDRDPNQAQKALSTLTSDKRKAWMDAMGQQGALDQQPANREQRRAMERMQKGRMPAPQQKRRAK